MVGAVDGAGAVALAVDGAGTVALADAVGWGFDWCCGLRLWLGLWMGLWTGLWTGAVTGAVAGAVVGAVAGALVRELPRPNGNGHIIHKAPRHIYIYVCVYIYI